MQKSVSAERNIELVKKLIRIAAELRSITEETGAIIRIQTEYNRRIHPDPCSVMYFGTNTVRDTYKLEHLFDGADTLHWKGVYTIRPEEIRWTQAPKRYERRK